MFVLKELENSDVRCGCVTTNYADIKAAQNGMKEQFEKTKKLLHGEFDDQEKDEFPAELQRWASISPMSAHIQDGLDAYDWEICEDPNWVSKDDAPEGFVIVGSITDNNNGDLIPLVPIYAKTEAEAKAILKEVYQKELDKRGLEDNDACDENDDSCPGGCLNDTCADVWDNAAYAFDCLVNVAHFSYFPLSRKEERV